MIRPSGALSVYICREAVDMRKSIDGLAMLAEQIIGESPFGEKLFVFCNRRHDKLKMLLWERNGFVLWYKRLEQQRFAWPRHGQSVIHLSLEQLNLLLDGYNVWQMRPHQSLSYASML